MKTALHERLSALREFLSPPSANAATPPTLALLDEVIKVLTPPKPGERAATAVEFPWSGIPVGTRLVTGGYQRSQVAAYGDARAAERDAYWLGIVRRFDAVDCGGIGIYEHTGDSELRTILMNARESA